MFSAFIIMVIKEFHITNRCFTIWNKLGGMALIYGNINNLGNLSAYPEKIAKVLNYLQGKDFISMEPGVYEIEGKDIFVQVLNANADIIENKRPEVHKKYIDLQFSPAGGEILGFATDTGNNKIDEELFDSKDIMFYTNMENETFIKTQPGDFLVFFPWDVHRPGCVEDGPKVIRKVVVKININIL